MPRRATPPRPSPRRSSSRRRCPRRRPSSTLKHVALNRIVLFYGFTPLPDPDAIRLWQRALCEKLGLTGRIIISKDGINAT
ncbi:MAG: rhodanese-related sulfurtransferase, partial [Arthrobacter sp.]|nr:rhodanese-related sulfurtransferase [Arthrobacter sp.]